MEVKDIRPEFATSENTTGASTARTKKEELSSPNVSPSSNESVRLDLTTRESAISINALRSNLNEIINVVNVASQATGEIDRIVNSISGIVVQASNANTSENRKVVLQDEANALLDQLKRTVVTEAPGGTKPLAGDPVRLEIEEKLGKTLEFLLPDHSKDSFGLSSLNFSPKESIIQIQTSVENAKRQIQALKKAVEETHHQVQTKADELDVAFQNSEASKSSIRDLDQALELASTTERGIESNPTGALRTFGKLEHASLVLLE